MKFNSHVIFLIAIVGIITAGVVGATILNNGSMKQVDFDGIKVNVPADADFIKTQDGYADAKYGITIKTFQNNQSMVNYLKGINGVTVVALKNQPPQSLAYVQGDNTNILVTNGGQGISIGAKDQGLVTDMSNSVVFSNHQKSVKPKVAVPGIAPHPHMDVDVDFFFIKNMLLVVNNPELNVAVFVDNVNNITVNGFNNAADNGDLDSYTANEFMPATSTDGAISDNQQQNTSLLDNPQASDVVSSLSSDSSNNAAGGDSASSDSAPVISSDGSAPASSGSAPASSGSAPSISSDSSSGDSPSSDGNSQYQKLTKEEIQRFAMNDFPGKTIDLKDITDKGDYFLVLIKDSHGKIEKYKYDAYDGQKIEKITN